MAPGWPFAGPARRRWVRDQLQAVHQEHRLAAEARVRKWAAMGGYEAAQAEVAKVALELWP